VKNLLRALWASGPASVDAPARRYGIALRDGTVEFDEQATEALRDQRRFQRIVEEPPDACAEPVGERYNRLFNVADAGFGRQLVWRRWGRAICAVDANLYDSVVVHEQPAAPRAPLGLEYEGAEQFVVRSCHCSPCAHRFDVQVGLVDEEVVRAGEVFT
jgi:hypothetical protein